MSQCCTAGVLASLVVSLCGSLGTTGGGNKLGGGNATRRAVQEEVGLEVVNMIEEIAEPVRKRIVSLDERVGARIICIKSRERTLRFVPPRGRFDRKFHVA